MDGLDGDGDDEDLVNVIVRKGEDLGDGPQRMATAVRRVARDTRSTGDESDWKMEWGRRK